MKKQNKLLLFVASVLSLGIVLTACEGGLIENSSSGMDSTPESSMPSSSQTIEKFSIAVNKCEGVNVICDEEVEKNGSIQFTVELLNGYEGELTITATVGGVETTVTSGIGDFYIISGINGDVVITVTGATPVEQVEKFSITVNKCEGVNVICDEEVEKNGDIRFTVEHLSGYEGEIVITATVGGLETTVSVSDGVYLISGVTGEVVITVTGATPVVASYGVSFFTSDDGIILPDETIVEEGESLEFEIALEEGYQKKDFWVKANGVDVAYDETKGKYVIENVTSYLDITVGGTEIITYVISFTGDVDGAIQVEPKTYGYFDEYVIFAVPLTEHYTQSPLTVTYESGDKSGTLTADETGYYKLENLKADIKVNVTGITLNKYTVNFLLNGESKYSMEVDALSSLTSEQLEIAQAEVVEGTEYSFVRWTEDSGAVITGEASFSAEVIWGETIAENAIRSKKFVTAEKDMETTIPDGYTALYKGVWATKDDGSYTKMSKDGFADVNVMKYSKIKFAVKGNTWLIDDSWTIAYDLRTDWVEIFLEKAEGTKWNITFTCGKDIRTATGNGEMLQGILHNYFAQLIEGVDGPYEMYATDIRGVKDIDYEASAPVDEKLGTAVIGGIETTDVTVPVGYENVYAVSSVSWSDAPMDRYAKANFKILSNGWHLFESWNKCEMRYTWLEVSVVKTDDGWMTTISDNGNIRYEATLSGSALKEVLGKYQLVSVDEENDFKVYVTELRGEKLPPEPAWADMIAEVPADNFALVTDREAPSGFEKVYYRLAPETAKFSDVDISKYGEVRFQIALTGGYVAIQGYAAFAQNAQFGASWHLVTLTNNTDGSWIVEIDATLVNSAGEGHTSPYRYTASGTTLQAVMAGWFDFASSDAAVYLTEIRGEKIEPWGTQIIGVSMDGFAESTDKSAAIGFEHVYYREDVAAGSTFAEIDISSYSEVRFYLTTANGYFDINGWGAYGDHNGFGDAWHLISLINNGNDSWTVTINAVLAGGSHTNPYVYDSTGKTLKEVLSSWFANFANNADIYLTEIRGEKIELWGTQIIGVSMDGFAESTDKSAAIGFEHVYYHEDVAAGSTFAEIDISSYSEVRFYLTTANGYFDINGWGAYGDNNGFGDGWHLISLINNGNDSWTVTINAVLAGGSHTNPYVYDSTGKTLKEVLSSWFANFANNADIYLTEIRAK